MMRCLRIVPCHVPPQSRPIQYSHIGGIYVPSLIILHGKIPVIAQRKEAAMPDITGAAGAILSGIVTNILTDAVYRGYSNIRSLKRTSTPARTEIRQRISEFLKNYDGTLIESATFAEYLELPQVSDTLQDYAYYTAASCSAKGKPSLSTSEQVIDYLTRNALSHYHEELTVPDRRMIEKFFSDFFDVSRKYYFDRLSEREQYVLFLIGDRLAKMEEHLSRNISRDVLDKNEQYTEIMRQYTAIIRKWNQSLFVYGFRELKLDDFYVIPKLVKHPGPARFDNMRFDASDIINYHISDGKLDTKTFCPYTDIFRSDDIIYVIGGPGYGKSILLKNIVLHSDRMNFDNSGDYLVIRCDLKTFYKNPQGRTPSVIEFLIESMVEESGMSRNDLTEDFLNYYLKIGRVIVLFDALDEVPRQYRTKLHKTITSYFLSYSPKNKICITSRERGFYPQNEIPVFEIQPLRRKEIDTYLDRMIRLHYFREEDKPVFFRQANALVSQKFLNSFLLLSLLVSIFQAEKELPQTKVELYSKCFSYISRDREKDKAEISEKYNWNDILRIMKDSTFIELSKLACPNNESITEETILDVLSKVYKQKFGGIARAETAVEEFLRFCSERTELFVPAQQEGSYRFFHRSFFEYFYSKYLSREKNVRKIVQGFRKFDQDSEVFELTAAILKNEDEFLYQQLIEYLLDKASEGLLADRMKADMLNILTLVMQAVDDQQYIFDYCKLFLLNSRLIASKHFIMIPLYRGRGKFLKNETVISSLLQKFCASDPQLHDLFYQAYRKYAFPAVAAFLSTSVFQNPEQILAVPDGPRFLRAQVRAVPEMLKNEYYMGVIFSHPDWKNFFMESVKNLMPDRPVDNPEGLPDELQPDKSSIRQFVISLNRLDQSQLEKYCDLIFGTKQLSARDAASS